MRQRQWTGRQRTTHRQRRQQRRQQRWSRMHRQLHRQKRTLHQQSSRQGASQQASKAASSRHRQERARTAHECPETGSHVRSAVVLPVRAFHHLRERHVKRNKFQCGQLDAHRSEQATPLHSHCLHSCCSLLCFPVLLPIDIKPLSGLFQKAAALHKRLCVETLRPLAQLVPGLEPRLHSETEERRFARLDKSRAPKEAASSETGDEASGDDPATRHCQRCPRFASTFLESDVAFALVLPCLRAQHLELLQQTAAGAV